MAKRVGSSSRKTDLWLSQMDPKNKPNLQGETGLLRGLKGVGKKVIGASFGGSLGGRTIGKVLPSVWMPGRANVWRSLQFFSGTSSRGLEEKRAGTELLGMEGGLRKKGGGKSNRPKQSTRP